MSELITMYKSNVASICKQKGLKGPSDLHFASRVSLNTAKAHYQSVYIPLGARVDTLIKIADSLGVTIMDLFGDRVEVVDESETEATHDQS